MKRALSFFLGLILALTPALFTACEKSVYDETLKIYNWDDYIYDDDLEEFVEYYFSQTGKRLQIVYVTFDTNETMLTKVLNDSTSVDVICPSEYAIEKLIAANKLLRINYFDDTNDIYNNEQNVNADLVKRIRDCFGELNLIDYMVPYMYGTLGILYNTDVVSHEEAVAAGWGLLWNENISQDAQTALNSKIFMKDSVRDSYAAALLYLKEKGGLPAKYSSYTVEQLINGVDDTLIALAEEVLVSQKDVLLGYEVDLGKNDLIKGRAKAGLAWSGDAMYSIEEAREYGVNLDYFVPDSGGNVWFDGWVIPTTCNNERAAKMFIDWLNNPEVAMANMMEIGYSSAVDKGAILANEQALQLYYDAYEIADNEEAKEQALAYFFDDVRRYPDVGSPNLGVMRDFGANNEKVITMWNRVKASGFNYLYLLIIVLAIAVIVAAALLLVKNKNKSNKKVKINK